MRTSLSKLRQRLQQLGPAGISGLLLLACAIAALVMANTSAVGAYTDLFQTKLTVGVGDAKLAKPLILWVNDGLMAIFFLLVGLEIKREMIVGALSTPRRAALPIFAALGGMVIPAGIYALINARGGQLSGWPIPAATDIAFALGVLALLGNRVPTALKVFLVAVAVVDDLGAVLIIATFLTSKVALGALLVAAGLVAGLTLLNRLRVHTAAPYVIGGIALWLAVLLSGVHATVAGIALALVIPMPTRAEGGAAPDSPLLRWEHGLEPWVLYGIIPVFAFANAGVAFASIGSEALGPVSLGVGLGLLFGKPIGITLFAYLAVRFGWAENPHGVSWRQIHGAGWLGGIGFTMSLFIANLSLTGSSLGAAKLGLFAASLVAGVIGTVILVRAASPASAPAESTTAAQPLADSRP